MTFNRKTGIKRLVQRYAAGLVPHHLTYKVNDNRSGLHWRRAFTVDVGNDRTIRLQRAAWDGTPRNSSWLSDCPQTGTLAHKHQYHVAAYGLTQTVLGLDPPVTQEQRIATVNPACLRPLVSGGTISSALASTASVLKPSDSTISTCGTGL